MPGSKNLLSVIIPVYNGERFIQEAIQSVLDQNYRELEIIVIDDGSTDRTQEKVKAFPEVHYLHQKNSGPSVARNTGLKNSKGNLIGFLDSDDLWKKGRTKIMFDKFEQDPALEIVLGNTQAEALPGSGPIEPNFLKPHIIPLFGSGLFKRSVFEKVGLIDSSLRYSEDQDWFMRVKESGIKMVIIPEVVLIRRLHSDNMTTGKQWKDVDLTKVLKKSLDRRRQANDGKAGDLPKLSDYTEE